MTSEAVQMLLSEIEQTVERLIGLLDLVDPDPDLEAAGDDELALGWTEKGPEALGQSCDDDREREDEHDEDGGDTEWNGDEIDYDGGENDAPGLIGGGLGL